MMAPTIRFSPTQASMLADRLGLPECIADALDGWDAFKAAGQDREDIERRCFRLEDMVRSGKVDLAPLDELDRLILADAHDGSTWWAIQESEAVNALAIARATRTVVAVQRKLREAGIKVDEPVLW